MAYLDYAASTPVAPAVAAEIAAWLSQDRAGNASATGHAAGRRAAEAVTAARIRLTSLINGEPEAVIWTSGATEANNLALQGVLSTYARPDAQLLVAATEHDSVLACAAALEKKGVLLRVIPVDERGLIDLAALADLLARTPTTLVCIAHVNNETGITQDIPAVSALTRAHGALLHVDAAQSLGKLPIDVVAWQADLVAFSGHKIHGPPGVGALYVRRRPRLKIAPLLRGGGQQMGIRAGSLPVPLIAGFAAACDLARQQMEADRRHCTDLQRILRTGLEGLDVIWNSDETHGVPWIQNFSLPRGAAADLLAQNPALALSAGSACHAGESTPSHVLLAMGRTVRQALAAVRVSFGRYTTDEEIAAAVQAVRRLCGAHNSPERLESVRQRA